MIITVTLNPAIDHALVLPKFVAGDTIRVKSVRSDPGGKGINVSRVIHELGGESLAMGFAPGGLGRYIEQTLDSQGIPCDFLHTRGEPRTNITTLAEPRHMQTILSDPGPQTDPHYVVELKKRLRRRLHPGDWLVLAGSIPPPLDASVYTEIIHEAAEMGVHTVLDADGAALAAGAAAHPEIVKGNRREMERLLGRHPDDEGSMLGAGGGGPEPGVSYLVVTRGREGGAPAAERSRLR